MSKGAKQNWFQSPHIKNGTWIFHEQRADFCNLSRIAGQQRITFLSPSRQSKPIQMQKAQKYFNTQLMEPQKNRFEDINLPDMFSNTLIERNLINQKLNFQESSVISEENDYLTPSRQMQHEEQADAKSAKELPKTAVKERHEHHAEEKKTRPKEKGLRMLSQKAYEIVLKMNGATYKQVANKLVDELAVQDTLEINTKDEQNIKRRVYDALNVLIALGILKKEGRKIYGLKKQAEAESQIIDRAKELINENQTKQFRIIERIKQYKDLKIQAQMIRALIRRNSRTTHNGNKINFPFLGVSIEQKDENVIDLRRERIMIRTSDKAIRPLGDMNLISYLKPALRQYMQ